MSARGAGRPVLSALAPLGAVLFFGALAGCADVRSGPPRVGEPAPAFQSTGLDGEELSLAELRGEPVLLNLWATWCTPCRAETPYLQALYEANRERGLRVVGVTVDAAGSLRQINSFLDEFGVTYDILHDPGSESMNIFSVWGLPATFLIDRDGLVRFIRLGPIDEGDVRFEAALEEILS